MKNVRVTWWEAEQLTTEYVSVIEVPDDFDAWDKDDQDEHLQGNRHEAAPLELEVVQGHVVESGIAEWEFTNEEATDDAVHVTIAGATWRVSMELANSLERMLLAAKAGGEMVTAVSA